MYVHIWNTRQGELMHVVCVSQTRAQGVESLLAIPVMPGVGRFSLPATVFPT